MVGGDPPGRQPGEEVEGVVAVVAGVDEQVVDVQQQVAVGLVEYRVDELDLAHLPVRRCIVGNVLHRDAPLQAFLRLADARRDVTHRGLGERQRQQIIEMAIVGTVTEVLAVQRDPVADEEASGLLDEGGIQRCGAAEGQRETVAGQWKALHQALQVGTEGTADADPVVRRAFEEVHRAGRHRQQLRKQAAPQAEAGGVVDQGHGIAPETATPPLSQGKERAPPGCGKAQCRPCSSLLNSPAGIGLPLAS